MSEDIEKILKSYKSYSPGLKKDKAAFFEFSLKAAASQYYESHFENAIAILNHCLDIKDNSLTRIETIALYNQLAIAYKAIGKYSEAKDSINQVLKSQINLLGKENLDVAQTYLNLADLYIRLEQFVKAEELCKSALEILDSQLAPNNLKLVTAYKTLSLAYRYQHKFSEAMELLKLCADIEALHLGEDNLQVSETLYYLANKLIWDFST